MNERAPHLAKPRTILCGREDAQTRIVIFHGYTSSPDEFSTLARTLAERLDARVVVPLLPGHGTEERELLSTTLDDLLAAARAAVRQEAAQGKSLFLIGNSLGGFLALLSCDIRMPDGLVISATPYRLRPRFRRPWAPYAMRMKKFWKKEAPPEELKQREHLFFYPRMPGNALLHVSRSIRKIKKILPTVRCPVLTIYNQGDPIAEPESGERIIEESGSNPLSNAIVLEHDSHGLYYGPNKDRVIREIGDFIAAVKID